MKMIFDHPRGRLLLLIFLFILLSGMIVLIYTHPDKKKEPVSRRSSYEQNIRNVWYTQIEQLLAKGDFHNARLAANKILFSLPGDLFARRILVRTAAGENDRQTAIQICRGIIHTNPEDAFSRNNLAVLLFAENPEEARREINIAIRLMPDNPVIISNSDRINHRKTDEKIPVPQNRFSDLLSFENLPQGADHE